MVNVACIGWHRHRQTSSSQGLPLQSTMKSAANTSKHRGTGMIAATAAETAAAACSHMSCMHSWTSKLVAAPQAANSGNLSKRKAQSRMTAESPCEFDKYLQVAVNKARGKGCTSARMHSLAFVLRLRKRQEAAQHHRATERPCAETRAASCLRRRAVRVGIQHEHDA